MPRLYKISARLIEAIALLMIVTIAVLGFLSIAAASKVREVQDPFPALPGALLLPALIAVSMLGFHIFLRFCNMHSEQVLWPAVSLLFVVGAIMIWRLRGSEGLFQQLL
ncbi:MAG: hypothetical protein ACM3H7_07795, partial [Acidobacteriaceae bacterium]